VDRCWADFRKLRQRKLWEPVLGCLGTMEIKARPGLGEVASHLHVLIARPSCRCLRGRRPGDGGPTCKHGNLWCPHALNQCCVSEAWREITGDSFVVDIRAVQTDEDGSMRGAVREVVKYCTKLTEVSSKQREDGLSDVLELHRAIRRRRLLITAGVFRGLVEPVTAQELLDQAESKPCPVCGTLWETVAAAWSESSGHYLVRGARRHREGTHVVRTELGGWVEVVTMGVMIRPPRLRLELARRGWANVDLARAAGISAPTVSAAMAGRPLA
jgi:hypothetical protein